MYPRRETPTSERCWREARTQIIPCQARSRPTTGAISPSKSHLHKAGGAQEHNCRQEPKLRMPKSKHPVPAEPPAWNETHHCKSPEQLSRPPFRLRGLLPRDESRYGMQGKAAWDCPGLITACLTSNQWQDKEGVQVIWGGTRMGKEWGDKKGHSVGCSACLLGCALHLICPICLSNYVLTLSWVRDLYSVCMRVNEGASAAAQARQQLGGHLCPWCHRM